MLSESHQNQLGMLNCPECTPFGYDAQDNMSMDVTWAIYRTWLACCFFGGHHTLSRGDVICWLACCSFGGHHTPSRGGDICWLACSFGGHHTPSRGGFIC